MCVCVSQTAQATRARLARQSGLVFLCATASVAAIAERAELRAGQASADARSRRGLPIHTHTPRAHSHTFQRGDTARAPKGPLCCTQRRKGTLRPAWRPRALWPPPPRSCATSPTSSAASDSPQRTTSTVPTRPCARTSTRSAPTRRLRPHAERARSTRPERKVLFVKTF